MKSNQGKKKFVTGWLRPVFLVFDAIFWIVSVLLLMYVFWIMGTNPVLRDRFANGIAYFTYTTLSIGLFIFFTTIFGFTAGLIEGTCLLKSYIAFVILIMLTEIFGGVSAYILRDRLAGYRYSTWLEFNTLTRDHIQKNLQCCGFFGFFDYNLFINELPDSCFIPGTENSPSKFPYTSGCGQNLDIWLNSSEGIAAWACTIAVISVVEILCLVFAILMLVKVLRAAKVSDAPAKPKKKIVEKPTKVPEKKTKAAVVQNNNKDVHAGKKPEKVATPVKPKSPPKPVVVAPVAAARAPTPVKPASPVKPVTPEKAATPVRQVTPVKPVAAVQEAPVQKPEPEAMRAEKVPDNNTAPAFERRQDAGFLRQYKPVNY